MCVVCVCVVYIRHKENNREKAITNIIFRLCWIVVKVFSMYQIVRRRYKEKNKRVQ